MSKKISLSEKSLIQRYLLWCYKTTKEDLDRFERKFTQVLVDRKVLSLMKQHKPSVAIADDYAKQLKAFSVYIDQKEHEGLNQKYLDVNRREVKANVAYLTQRLAAIESTIRFFLGSKDLKRIQAQYEQEMTRRILESREH